LKDLLPHCIKIDVHSNVGRVFIESLAKSAGEASRIGITTINKVATPGNSQCRIQQG
jgi:hypothetical protein